LGNEFAERDPRSIGVRWGKPISARPTNAMCLWPGKGGKAVGWLSLIHD
jgi:hypothetical protein